MDGIVWIHQECLRLDAEGKTLEEIGMSKYTKSARGQACTVRSPVCNGNPETVVLAHLNGAGIGRKHADIHGAYCCSACHAWLDFHYVGTHTRQERDLYHLTAVIETQILMVEQGVLKL